MRTLEQLKKLKKSECACEKCVDACKYRPGWFLPGEVEKVAEYLGLSLKVLFLRYLVLDYWTRVEGDIYVPCPGSSDEVGSRASFGFAFKASCIFLKEDRCVIHPVKPFECATALVCSPKLNGKVHRDIAMIWQDYDAWELFR